MVLATCSPLPPADPECPRPLPQAFVLGDTIAPNLFSGFAHVVKTYSVSYLQALWLQWQPARQHTKSPNEGSSGPQQYH